MDIVIGKYTLETLTSGMYERPRDIYREYIQNAVDSIDVAIDEKLISKEKARIDLEISPDTRQVIISDNGTGISINDAPRYLLDIGCSPKRFTGARGFRGIGRLAGLAYCQTLVFETSAFGEEKRTVVEFNAKSLCERMMNSEFDTDLLSLVSDVVNIKQEQEARTSHYFRVILTGVEETDGLLDVHMVRAYLEQVAPVDFGASFGWGKIIKSKLRAFNFSLANYSIYIGSKTSRSPIQKSYKDIFISDRLRKLEDGITDIDTREFLYDGEVIAYLWYAKTSFFGTLRDDAIKGIRVRKGNILIGDKITLNHIFKDERFNGWLFGELHLISPKLIPNARRDEVEKSTAYYSLINDLREWADGISSEIRKTSNQRSLDKKSQRIIELVQRDSVLDVEEIAVTVMPEIVLLDHNETEELNHAQLVAALDHLICTQTSNTKYKALNFQTKITIEQKRVLERVFDIICEKYNQQSNGLITEIIRDFVAERPPKGI